MKPTCIISHLLHLTKDERHTLQSPGTPLHTTGIICRVIHDQTTNEPALEEVGIYRICQTDNGPVLYSDKNTFAINLTKKQCERLLAPDAGGAGFIHFNDWGIEQVNDRLYPCLHQACLGLQEDMNSSISPLTN